MLHLIIINPKTRRRKSYQFVNSSNLKEVYKALKPDLPQCEFHVASGTPTEPPQDFKPPSSNKALHWCPYCATLRKFDKKTKPLLNTRNCRVCGISTQDFYVRVYNKLKEKPPRVRKKRNRDKSGLVVLNQDDVKKAMRKERRRRRKNK